MTAIYTALVNVTISDEQGHTTHWPKIEQWRINGIITFLSEHEVQRFKITVAPYYPAPVTKISRFDIVDGTV